MSTMKGLFIGRFQPLHLGHVSIMEAALSEVDQLVVGIGSAESSYTFQDPFTGRERFEMLLRWGADKGWSERIIPVPIRDLNRYSIWVGHVESLCPDFDIVYSNNPLTVKLFKLAGYEVRSTMLVDRGLYSGKGIRALMVKGDTWRELVPSSVGSYLDEIEGPSRIMDISEGGRS